MQGFRCKAYYPGQNKYLHYFWGSFIMIIPYSNHEGPYIWVEFAVCLLALVQSLPLELLSELQPFSEDRPFRAWGV